MIKRLLFSMVFISLILFYACQPSGEKTNASAKAQVSKEKPSVALKFDRFEMDLFSLPIDSIGKALPNLQKKYGVFLDIFTNKIINIGSTKRPGFPGYLKSFITDKYMYATYVMVKKEFPNLDDLKGQLEKAFQKYHEIFPDKVIPHVYSLITGFNQSVVAADTILGIGLDKYLGANCEYYMNLQLPQYERRTMEKEYMATDAMRGWCYTEFLFNDSSENVLTNILYQGKIIYLMKELFPEKNDTIIFGFTSHQMDWCKSNTSAMWTFLIERKLLFSTDYMTINKLTNPAPFTPFFNSESPGRAVNWVGYQIIKSYMSHNNITMDALLHNQNYQNILEQSKFRP